MGVRKLISLFTRNNVEGNLSKIPLYGSPFVLKIAVFSVRELFSYRINVLNKKSVFFLVASKVTLNYIYSVNDK